MANVARKFTKTEPSYAVGTVVAPADAEANARIVVRTLLGEREAERAASCLLTPCAGDEVGLLSTGDGRTFVVAILVRAGATAPEIAVDGDLAITARGGTCRIAATDGVELRSEGAVSLASKVLNLRATEGTVLLSKLTLMASSVLAHTESVRAAAKAIDLFCDRVSQKAKTWRREVEQLDVVRAGHIDYRTENEMCLRAQSFLVGARGLAKLDAEQIHIG